MKRSENGFTLLELAVVIALTAMIALAATTFTFHALRTAAKTDDRLTALDNAQNAGYWISRDAYMADTVITDNLTAPTILILKWTDWGYGTDNIYYSATYSVDNVTSGIGQLNRRLQDSNGGDQKIVVASYICYNPADPANSTNVTYQSPPMNLRVATRYGNASEVRNYEIYRRPNV